MCGVWVCGVCGECGVWCVWVYTWCVCTHCAYVCRYVLCVGVCVVGVWCVWEVCVCGEFGVWVCVGKELRQSSGLLVRTKEGNYQR